MSLSAALGTAKSSLLATQNQMAVVSRNVAGVSDGGYSRKIASTVSQGGAVQVSIQRAADGALHAKMLSSTSDVTYYRALNSGLDALNARVGDTESGQSPAAALGGLKSALAQFAQSPDNTALGRTAMAKAVDLATGLNAATKVTQAARADADAAVGRGVDRLNDLLASFQTANQDVISQLAMGKDASDALDVRDALISQISEELGVQVVERADGDVALYTDSGVTLFDKSPRSVTFQPVNAYSPGVVGNAVVIDGVPVTGAGSPMPLSSGNLVGHMAIRDDIAPAYQTQLDETARLVIDAFREVDQSGAGGPDLAGLFGAGSTAGLPGVPAPPGLAGSIAVNPMLLGTADGGVSVLRDGGVNGAAYRYNPAATGSDVSYSARLNELVGGFDQQRSVDPSSGFGETQSTLGFASGSAGWLQALRSTADSQGEYSGVVLYRASEALSNATGVNLDEETATMLQLEQSYGASAKLISTINEMMKILLSIA